MQQSLATVQAQPPTAEPDMTLHLNAGFRRKTAFLLLLAWLFALASGVANACLLEARTVHPHAMAAPPVAGPVPSASAGLAYAGADHHDDGPLDSPKAPCLKVCDDSTRSLPKQHGTVDQVDPGAPLLVAVLWTGAAPVIHGPNRLDALQPAPAGPPMRIRFARLAL